jgi:hypothetical protein
MVRPLRHAAILLPLSGLAALGGCLPRNEPREPSLTQWVGIYVKPPPGIARPRVAVPSIEVTGRWSGKPIEEGASDSLMALVYKSGRFEVIERGELADLLAAQGLEWIVRGVDPVRPAEVRGIDLLFLGKVTDLRVRAARPTPPKPGDPPTSGAAGGPGVFDFWDSGFRIAVGCGLDLRLVDPATGKVEARFDGEYRYTDSIGEFGIHVQGIEPGPDGDLRIDEYDVGGILRIILDEGLMMMLPEIDAFLVRRPPAAAPASKGPMVPSKFCPSCGNKLVPAATSCPSCGWKA